MEKVVNISLDYKIIISRFLPTIGPKNRYVSLGPVGSLCPSSRRAVSRLLAPAHPIHGFGLTSARPRPLAYPSDNSQIVSFILLIHLKSLYRNYE